MKPVTGLSTACMNACMHRMFLLLVINGPGVSFAIFASVILWLRQTDVKLGERNVHTLPFNPHKKGNGSTPYLAQNRTLKHAATQGSRLGRLQAEQSQAEVAQHLNVNQSTISRLWTRFQQTGSTADRPRAGRPRATTPAQDCFLRLRHLRNRFLPASSSVQALCGVR